MSSKTLLATALADAHGLVAEGLTPRRLRRLFPPPLPVFGVLPGHGLVSDDTEHAAITAQAFIASGGDPAAFEKELARRLKRWLWALPPATGLATGRALIRLSIGYSPKNSGARSAGNGPCMRAPVLGALVRQPGALYDLVKRSSRMTHQDTEAIHGAFLVARWVSLAKELKRSPTLAELKVAVSPWVHPKEPWLPLLDEIAASVGRQQLTSDFVYAKGWKKGPTGYVVHTVAAVLHCLHAMPGTWEEVVRGAVQLGGDTDSVAALVGALAIHDPARGPLPEAWLAQLKDWPMTPSWLITVGDKAEQAALTNLPSDPPELFFFARVARNVGFLGLILWHGVRRLLPPY
jgi:hypothetical protein